MADRTAAKIFGKVFTALAKNPTEENKALASEIYGDSRDFDFSPYQMYCDEALIKLDLVHMGVDPRYPEDGKVLLYGPVPKTT